MRTLRLHTLYKCLKQLEMRCREGIQRTMLTRAKRSALLGMPRTLQSRSEHKILASRANKKPILLLALRGPESRACTLPAQPQRRSRRDIANRR